MWHKAFQPLSALSEFCGMTVLLGFQGIKFSKNEIIFFYSEDGSENEETEMLFTDLQKYNGAVDR